MDLSFMANHVVQPQFTAGSSYDATIVASVDKDSGFTLELSFAELSVPAFWHFNVAHESEDAKRISADELKGLIDQIGEPIAQSSELVGKTVHVRLLSQQDSALPKCALPVQTKRGNQLSL
jgi:hypothetical protein